MNYQAPKLLLACVIGIILAACNPALKMQQSNPLPSIMSARPEFFDTILRHRPELRVQIIYTQIDRRKNGEPVFTDHFYGVDDNEYFYPASTVKLPVALLALQRLNELSIPGLDRNTTMITETAFEEQTAVYNDPTSFDGRPTVEHYIKKILLVSDNDAFNRLYGFLGQEYINKTLHQMGYDSVQILHRLDIFLTEQQNRRTNPVRFYDTASRVIYDQPGMSSSLVYQKRNTRLGKGFMRGGKLVNEPLDFSIKNRLPLTSLHSILKAVIFPDAVKPVQRFKLTEDDRAFVLKYMSMVPRESTFPVYDSSYQDNYVKFLFYGAERNGFDPQIRSFNKPGDAYGFMIDAAYIADFRNDIEFMVSAVIYCNSDGILNDDNYDYDELGYPFMKNLGRAIYEHELKRNRQFKPDLSEFVIEY